jgi:trimeric autotransporter adhesin
MAKFTPTWQFWINARDCRQIGPVLAAAGLSLHILSGVGGGALAQCSPEWMTGNFGAPGTTGIINAFTVFNDGTPGGAALIASGVFNGIGGIATTGIARWDGTQWSALGPGLTGRITGLGTFDDGGGPALYATGNYTQIGGNPVPAIGTWDGQGWAPLQGGGLTRSVGAAAGFTITVYDHGAGPFMYVGGSFEFAGGLPALNIARWDGQAWHSVGGSTGTVNCFRAWDDGTGPQLYAGGNITMIGGVPAAGIARYDGTTWTTLGTGVTGGFGRVNAMAIYNDGGGDALYVGGNFTHAGGVPAASIARWDGTAWSALTGGGIGGGTNTLSTMAVFDDGQGPALFVGGGFTEAGGMPVDRIAKWTSAGWSAVPNGPLHPSLATVSIILAHDDQSGIGQALFIGGGFTEVGGAPAGSLTRYGCAAVCIANCDGSTVQPVLNVDDFTCFINEFAAAQSLPGPQQVEHYANCDGSTIAPVLNVDDFTCFINLYAQGCR